MRKPNADLPLADLVASAAALGCSVHIQLTGGTVLDDKSKRMARMVESVALLPRVLPPVTEWFEPAQQPGRSGVYEVVTNTPGKTRYRYFDGLGNWYYGADTPREALAAFQVSGVIVFAMKWRGLTERAE